MSWSALSSLVAMPFGQLSPRKSESRACYLTNVAADKRSSGCAWLCHALILTRLQLNFVVGWQGEWLLRFVSSFVGYAWCCQDGAPPPRRTTITSGRSSSRHHAALVKSTT